MNNCRIQLSKNIIVDNQILDVFAFDVEKNGEWFEISFPFTIKERRTKQYKNWERLYNLANK